jgi:hypothetical protein
MTRRTICCLMLGAWIAGSSAQPSVASAAKPRFVQRLQEQHAERRAFSRALRDEPDLRAHYRERKAELSQLTPRDILPNTAGGTVGGLIYGLVMHSVRMGAAYGVSWVAGMYVAAKVRKSLTAHAQARAETWKLAGQRARAR